MIIVSESGCSENITLFYSAEPLNLLGRTHLKAHINIRNPREPQADARIQKGRPSLEGDVARNQTRALTSNWHEHR